MILVIIILLILFILWTMLKCASLADENINEYINKKN